VARVTHWKWLCGPAVTGAGVSGGEAALGRVAGVGRTGAPGVKLTGVRLWGDLRNTVELPGIHYGTTTSGVYDLTNDTISHGL